MLTHKKKIVGDEFGKFSNFFGKSFDMKDKIEIDQFHIKIIKI